MLGGPGGIGLYKRTDEEDEREAEESAVAAGIRAYSGGEVQAAGQAVSRAS